MLRDTTCNQSKSPQPLVLRIHHASHMKPCDQVWRGGFTTYNEDEDGRRRITAGIPISPSFLSILQPKRRAHSRYTHTLCQVFRQKPEILIRSREGNLVVAAEPDQPAGDPWTGLSLICVQTVFISFFCIREGVTILTVHGFF